MSRGAGVGWKLTGASSQRTLNNHPFWNNGHVGDGGSVNILRNICWRSPQHRGKLHLLLLFAFQSQTLR